MEQKTTNSEQQKAQSPIPAAASDVNSKTTQAAGPILPAEHLLAAPLPGAVKNMVPATNTQDTTELLQRVQADFENYIKRIDKEKAEIRLSTTERVVTKLLNTLDDFQRAFDHLKQGCSHDDFVKGMTLVFTHFQKILTEEGLKEVKATGKVNPYEHEVLLQEESKTVPEGIILQELQKGYLLNGRLLRSAKVKVAKTPQNPVPSSATPQQGRSTQ